MFNLLDPLLLYVHTYILLSESTTSKHVFFTFQIAKSITIYEQKTLLPIKKKHKWAKKHSLLIWALIIEKNGLLTVCNS